MSGVRGSSQGPFAEELKTRNETMSQPLTPTDFGKRRYWGTAGFIGVVVGLIIAHFSKSDLWIPGGMVLGLFGGFVVAAIRDSDEL
jgi:hypothetical protein